MTTTEYDQTKVGDLSAALTSLTISLKTLRRDITCYRLNFAIELPRTRSLTTLKYGFLHILARFTL
jgi:hypothetical protein